MVGIAARDEGVRLEATIYSQGPWPLSIYPIATAIATYCHFTAAENGASGAVVGTSARINGQLIKKEVDVYPCGMTRDFTNGGAVGNGAIGVV